MYKVWAYNKETKINNGPNTTFEVFPDSVSSTYSRVKVLQDSAPADETKPVKIQVQLRDEHGNPVPNHFVELVSSRAEDTIEIIGNKSTDSYGEVLFHIRSSAEGVSYYSILDRNSGIILEERAKAVFFESQPEKSRGGDALMATLFETTDIFGPDDDDDNSGEFGITDHFKVELKSASGKQLQKDPWDLTITAEDADENQVRYYTGNIVITADDSNVELPKDSQNIEFDVSNQGQMNFSKVISFPASGKYTIRVQEFDPEEGGFTDVKGEATVQVYDKCQGENCDGDSTLDPEKNDIFIIDRPKDQSTFRNKTITIKGKNIKGNEIQVYLDDREVKTILPDADGSFFDDTIPIIKDGEHVLVFEDLELNKKSDPITFSVDSTPPTVDKTSIDPSGDIQANDQITLIMFSEPGLGSANMTVNDTNISQDFTEDKSNPGKYSATIRAPEKDGEYTINISISDKYDNPTKSQNVESFTVVAGKPTLTPPKNLILASQDGGSILLQWEAPDSEGAGLNKYQILSGTNSLFMSPFAQVSSDVTEKEINGVTPGEKRYYSIVAIDNDRNESEPSNLISVVPQEPVHPVTDIDETETPPTTINLSNTLNVIPGDGEIYLQWSDPKVSADFFDVRFGISSGVHSERFLVSGETRSATIPDLINGVAYYITVVPMNINGAPTGESYDEKYAMPIFAGLHKAAEYQPNQKLDDLQELDKDGPESIYILLLSISFSFAMFFFHRALRLSRI